MASDHYLRTATSHVRGRRRRPRAAAEASHEQAAVPRARSPWCCWSRPSVILLLLINAYPLVYAFNQSLHNGTLIITGEFVGLDNYIDVLTRDRSGSRPLHRGLHYRRRLRQLAGRHRPGSAAAHQDPRQRRLQGAVDAAVGGADRGVLHRLELAGRHPGPAPSRRWPATLGFGEPLFLADPTLAAITVCIFKVWVSFPFMMLMTSAALASVDGTVYEAANMDGAIEVAAASPRSPCR